VCQEAQDGGIEMIVKIRDARIATVNGKRVDIPSALVYAGDVIAIAEKSRSNAFFKALAESNASLGAPAWLSVDKEHLSGTVTRFPNRDEIDVPVNEQAIVELYSK